MYKDKKDRLKRFDQKKLIRNIIRLDEENQKLEKKYMLASQKLNELKSSMKNLKHDLRSPLSGITGMIDLVLIDNKDELEVQTSDLMMIKESAQSMLDLIHGTFVVEGSEKNLNANGNGNANANGKMNIYRVLSSVIMELNRLYLPMAKSKNISLSLSSQINTEVTLTPNLYIDLIKIAGNLIANAVKFTPANGSVDVAFPLDANDNISVCAMAVTDTGKGMSPDQVSAFNQAKPVQRSLGTNGEQSFGIGLQHVIKMVSHHNGTITVKSEESSGTVFSVFLPLPNDNLTRKSLTHFSLENGTISHNGDQH